MENFECTDNPQRSRSPAFLDRGPWPSQCSKTDIRSFPTCPELSLRSQKYVNWRFSPSCNRIIIWNLYYLEPKHRHNQETKNR